MNEDIFERIGIYLTPSDFYGLRSTCKEASRLRHESYWDYVPTRDILIKAIPAHATSVIEWLVLARNDVNIDIEIFSIACKNGTSNIQLLFYGWGRQAFNPFIIVYECVEALQQLVQDGSWCRSFDDVWYLGFIQSQCVTMARLLGISIDNIMDTAVDPTMVVHLIKYSPPTIILLNQLYIDHNYEIIATIYNKWPDHVNNYIWADGLQPIEVDWILMMIPHLTTSSKHKLQESMEKLYDHAWANFTHRQDALPMIQFMYNNGFASRRDLRYYLPAARTSPWPDYARFLVFKGMSIQHKDYIDCPYVDTARVLFDAYYASMIEPMLIIICIFIFIIIYASCLPKLKKQTSKYYDTSCTPLYHYATS
jgi:hypothetical protein